VNESVWPNTDDLDPDSEEAHLLRSPTNARRLFAAWERAMAGEGQIMSIDEVRLSLDADDRA
jgi:hypothetical protein